MAFALAVREHGTPEAVQATAHRLVSKVPMEKQPNMKRLARGIDIPKDKAIPCAELIIDTVCKAWHV